MSQPFFLSPSAIQGNKYLKRRLAKGQEGFQNHLTTQTKKVIDANDYSAQKQTMESLQREYQQTLDSYNQAAQSLQSNVSGYIDRVSDNHPYHNKVVQFSTGELAYVTNQGVLKPIPSRAILSSLSPSVSKQTPVPLNVPWDATYATPNTRVSVTPPLITGTNVQTGQQLGHEGANVYVSQLLPDSVTASFMGCFASSPNNDNMTILGGAPATSKEVTVPNGTFSQPALTSNTYQYITSASTVPGWQFNASVLLHNSSAWGFPVPYPNGNQCACIQRNGSISTLLKLSAGEKYTLTLYACARNCCLPTNTGNPVDIQLYTTTNAFIQDIATLAPTVNEWKKATFEFQVPTSQTYQLVFKGTTTDDQSTAIQDVNLSSKAVKTGVYSYTECKQAAIQQGYQYFALQNVNTQTSKGFCAVSKSQPAITQYGSSKVPSKAIALWSSRTRGQPGNSALLSSTGSLQVLNASGQVVFSTPSTNATPANYLGCYQDCSKGRGLETRVGKKYTYEKCQEEADKKGAKYFGLQNVQPNKKGECWVGNDLGKATSMGKASNCSAVNGVSMGGGCSNALYDNENASSHYYLVLQNDGDMCIYRGKNPSDDQGKIWCAGTAGKQRQANPSKAAAKGKYAQNWMPSGGTLAPGDFVSSTDGKMALVMQSDGDLVLFAFEMESNCAKMSDGNVGGGEFANAAYDLGVSAVRGLLGKLGFVDANGELHPYPSTNQQFADTYSSVLTNSASDAPDLPGKSFSNATLEQCKKVCNDQDDNCAGFLYDRATQTCFPKSGDLTRNVNPQPDADLYVRDKVPAKPPMGVSQNTVAIDTLTYGAYPQGSEVDANAKYGLAGANSTQRQHLDQLQTRLSQLASQIQRLTGKFEEGTQETQDQGTRNNAGLGDYVDSLKETNAHIQQTATLNQGGLNNILQDSDVVVLQKNYDYLFWSILATGTVLISLTMN